MAFKEFGGSLPPLHNLTHGCANHATERKRFSLPIHCCDVTKPPYLFSGELCTSPLHTKRVFVYTTGAQITRLRVNASVPYPLLCPDEASLLAQWRTMYFTLAL